MMSPMPSPQELLNIFGRSSTELEGTWLGLEILCDEAQQFMTDVGKTEATNAEAKAKLARQMEILEESYHVLDAWTELVHAWFVLTTHGPQSVFFDGTPAAMLAGAPDIVRKRWHENT
ncbi:hypothetical protein [Haloechinothrix salitolerans]|uniref:Uncharacterized protein n=1 Tax=Haloechinothrix salitolerans TaxID=926830 RepID=A0ABW2C3W1_9PSEU